MKTYALPPRFALLALLMGVLALSLIGCGQGKDQGQDQSGGREKQVSPSTTAVARDPASPAAESGQNGKVVVAITPQPATARDDLRAVFRGEAVVRSYRWEKNGYLLPGEDTDTLTRNNLQKGDEITVVIETDKGAEQASVSIVNARPQILSVPFRDPHVRRGADIEVEPEVVDVDGDTVSFRYSWVVNGAPVPMNDSPRLTGDLFRKGDRISLQVVPFDGTDEGYPFVGLDLVVPNAPPTFISSPPTNFLGNKYAYEVRAIDPDDDPLTYSLASAPSGMTIHAETGKISWQIGPADVGEHQIGIVVEDAEGMKAQQEYSLRIGIKTGAGGK